MADSGLRIRTPCRLLDVLQLAAQLQLFHTLIHLKTNTSTYTTTSMIKNSFLVLFLFVASATCAPAGNSATSSETSPASTVLSAIPEYETVAPASDAPNFQAYPQDTTEIPTAMNNGLGANILGPQNVALDQQNPDILAPPSTDSGLV